MKNTKDKIKRIKVDSLYGKKKHFNAADRKEKQHYWIGIPLIVINVLTGSVLFYVLTDGVTNWIKFIPLVLALIAALLSGFQTFLNLQKKVEGHRRVGNKYLAIMKRCDRLQAYIEDDAIKDKHLIESVEEIANEIEVINKEAESFPTSKSDYELAKKGIESGEESYTESELEL
ncbi:SLATT domain-containing protein [Paenimyroides aestuarii]|uniref:SLATT domain-containing protein n=1 Tax=Paenimyroides aestuarii TaxID=2968490 RepID=A0ABY5NQH0_9FLAO|nr:SLATT domain-containing protein [Paenimyroides aestuarii]UUV20778.1 SLATT domain-containing protein [Paenimyroides aestuarii]